MRRLAAALVGAVFGVTLCWTGMTSPVVLRDGLLFHKAYLFLFFGAAVITAFVGLRILRAGGPRALLTGERIGWEPVQPQRRHVAGALLFGVGWAVADACPGPIATQLGQGVWWSLATIAGLTVGLRLADQGVRAGGAGRPRRTPSSISSPSGVAPAAPVGTRTDSAE
jgi:uncharacterized membrane protein YedE/YeeE